jgi:tetratricopeptide (TPR) repeat protein
MQALSYDSMQQYNEAISCYDQVLELDPQNATAWDNKG